MADQDVFLEADFSGEKDADRMRHQLIHQTLRSDWEGLNTYEDSRRAVNALGTDDEEDSVKDVESVQAAAGSTAIVTSKKRSESRIQEADRDGSQASSHRVQGEGDSEESLAQADLSRGGRHCGTSGGEVRGRSQRER